MMDTKTVSALFIDDDPALLDIAKAYLENDGDVKVTTLVSPLEALVALETKRFDAIICDYQMPNVDGIQFLKTLRMQGRDTPFILFTGKGSEEVAIDALNNGATYYLQKGGKPGLKFQELLEMVRRSISRRESPPRPGDSEGIYERLFQENTEAMILVNLETGGLEDANAAACRLFGYDRDSLLAMSMQDLGRPPHGKSLVEARHRRSVQSTKTSMQIRRADGTLLDVQVFSGTLEVHGERMGYSIIHQATKS